MSSPGPGGGQFRPIGRAAPVSKREREAANNTRDMGLKVLYTFDDQSNTNCLARWSDAVSVRTAALDERTVVGVVALKTCVQAVVQSSPEMISKVGQDYTVYAYDYSESDVPQTGQGMLSWALMADTSSQLVTGRVCKNVLGLLSNRFDETLEVKLRLVPVRTAQQNEYSSAVEKSRQQGNQSDNNEWNTLVNAQPGLAQMHHTFSAQTISTNERDMVNRDEFSHVFNPMYGSNGGGSNNGISKAGSRASTPNATARGKRRGSQAKLERPSSAAPGKRPRGRPPKNPVPSGNISGSEDVVTDGDDGPSRKRVRPSEAERDGASSFGDPESLRIRASTAASIRGDLRPKPANPTMSAGNGRQEFPRAPTPVPKFPLQITTRGSNLSQSSLRRESLQSTGEVRVHASPYSDVPMDSGLGSEQIHLSIESAMTSPEQRDTPGQTPQDITSSPPVLTTGTPFSMPPPSSPILPQMPRREDSTYGGSGGLFGEEDEDDDICLIEVDGDGLAARQSAGPQQVSGTHEGETRITQAFERQALPPHKSQSISRRNSPRPQGQFEAVEPSQKFEARDQSAVLPEAPMPSPPNLPSETTRPDKPGGPTRAASFSSLNMPSAAVGDMSFAPPGLARSQTAAPQSTTQDRSESETPTSEALGRNIAKKARIVSKLEQAIANGELPDFCSNCGAIETPTWRKAFTQDLQGDPGFVEYSDEPGRIMAVTILARDEAGKAISYRIFKKSLAQTESFDNFTEIMLCNPCGIWVAKYKSHRPRENWALPTDPNAPPKTKKPRVRGKRRSQKNPQPVDNTNPTSEAYTQSEAYNQSEAPFPSEPNFQSDFQSEANFPPDFQSEANFPQSELPHTAFSPTPVEENENATRLSALPRGPSQSGQLMHASNNRLSHPQMVAVADSNPMGRSSPSRMRGGSRNSPIQLEPEFGTTRRLLFPSPRKDGSPKLLGGPEVVVRIPQQASSFRSPKEQFRDSYAGKVSNKENCAPANEEENTSISALFGEESPARPKTPTQSIPIPNPFKTPTRPSSTHRPVTRSQSKSVSAKKSMLINQSPTRTPTRTPRRSPRNHPDVIETPMSYMNRIFSQPDLQINLAAMAAENIGDFGDATDFSITDMGMNFNLFEDPQEALYIQPEGDEWNDIQYDVLGGHGEPIHDNEDLARILDGMADNEDATSAYGNPAEGEQTEKEASNVETPDSDAKTDEEKNNGDDKKQDDTKKDEVPQM